MTRFSVKKGLPITGSLFFCIKKAPAIGTPGLFTTHLPYTRKEVSLMQPNLITPHEASQAQMRILLTSPTCLLDEILSHESHLNQYVGWLNTPKYFGNFERYVEYDASMPIAIDNSAYTEFKSDRYEALIRKINVPIQWITVPDVVGNAQLTQILFNHWCPELEGLPLAYVAQDGAESFHLPWHRFDCLFIGGTTAWKLSPMAACLAREAKWHGKWLHMGRVNSDQRLRYAFDLGCDSVDGTGYTRFSKYHLKKALHFLHGLHHQQTISGVL